MVYRMAPVLVTLNDLEGHSLVAGLFKCNPSNICAVFYQISTNTSATAGLLVVFGPVSAFERTLIYLYRIVSYDTVGKSINLILSS